MQAILSSRRRGFTLIELLIVVAIIAILAAIAVPNFIEAQSRAKVSRAKADMRSLATAIEAYAVDNNQYPVLRQDGSWGHGHKWCEYLYYGDTNAKYPGQPWLSTPIAYISDYPQQAFTMRKEQNQGHQGFQNFSYLFINFKGASQDGASDDTSTFLGYFGLERGSGEGQIEAPMPINLIGGGYAGIKAYSNWILFGIGPSGVLDLDSLDNQNNAYGVNGTAAVRMTFSNNNSKPCAEGSGGQYLEGWRTGWWKAYDPTNGTLSLGFICRTQSGTPGE